MSMIDDIIDGIIKAEGGFVDHPDDRGGATCWGITEAVARAAGYTGAMRDLPRQTAVDIYRRRYVDQPGFGAIVPVSMAIAAELVDTGVNMGTVVAGRFLQRSLNALNRQGADWPDVAVDGVIGPATVSALRAAILKRGRPGELVILKALNALQGARYIELAEGRAANESFAFGWFQGRVA
ncbi:MAG: glycoside hydrolase family 108 protein [Polymorphobacter sp.]